MNSKPVSDVKFSFAFTPVGSQPPFLNLTEKDGGLQVTARGGAIQAPGYPEGVTDCGSTVQFGLPIEALHELREAVGQSCRTDQGKPVSDDVVELSAEAYADAVGYYVPFHRGLKSVSSNKIRIGVRAALEAAEQSQASTIHDLQQQVKALQTEANRLRGKLGYPPYPYDPVDQSKAPPERDVS